MPKVWFLYDRIIGAKFRWSSFAQIVVPLVPVAQSSLTTAWIEALRSSGQTVEARSAVDHFSLREQEPLASLFADLSDIKLHLVRYSGAKNLALIWGHRSVQRGSPCFRWISSFRSRLHPAVTVRLLCEQMFRMRGVNHIKRVFRATLRTTDGL